MRCSAKGRDVTYLLTYLLMHTIKFEDLTPMEQGAKPEECLGQANFDKSQGFSINPWDLKHHQDNDFTSKSNSLYLYFNKKDLKSYLDSLYITRASKYLAFCPHIFSILYSARTISGVKLQLQCHVALSVTPGLRWCSSTHINYNIVRNSKAT